MKRIHTLISSTVPLGLSGCTSADQAIIPLSRQLPWLKVRNYQFNMIHSEQRKAFFYIKENLTSAPSTSKP